MIISALGPVQPGRDGQTQGVGLELMTPPGAQVVGRRGAHELISPGLLPGEKTSREMGGLVSALLKGSLHVWQSLPRWPSGAHLFNEGVGPDVSISATEHQPLPGSPRR